MTDAQISRRTAVTGVGLAAVAGGVLTACGSGGEEEKPAETPAGPLGKTSEIPVGGGKVFAEQKVVVTQPTAGEFKAFSAICTHQGCTVRDVAAGTITCPCHQSKFAVTDGSVQGGPATQPLPAKAFQVDGDQITLT